MWQRQVPGPPLNRCTSPLYASVSGLNINIGHHRPHPRPWRGDERGKKASPVAASQYKYIESLASSAQRRSSLRASGDTRVIAPDIAGLVLDGAHSGSDLLEAGDDIAHALVDAAEIPIVGLPPPSRVQDIPLRLLLQSRPHLLPHEPETHARSRPDDRGPDPDPPAAAPAASGPCCRACGAASPHAIPRVPDRCRSRVRVRVRRRRSGRGRDAEIAELAAEIRDLGLLVGEGTSGTSDGGRAGLDGVVGLAAGPGLRQRDLRGAQVGEGAVVVRSEDSCAPRRGELHVLERRLHGRPERVRPIGCAARVACL